MGGRKRGGFFFRWIKSDLPDREDISSPVLLLAVHKTQPVLQEDNNKIEFITQVEPQTERHRRLLTQINDRFRKTLSLDSRTEAERNLKTSNDARPKSMVNTANFNLNNCSSNSTNTTNKLKPIKKKRFRPKSFFTLDHFLDSRRSEASSVDDFSSSKYCKFYLDSSAECSPVLKGRTTPDLLDLPTIVNTQDLSEELRCKKRLDKLENHFNNIQRLKNSKIQNNKYIEEPVYSEPTYDGSNTSQSTLVIGSNLNESSRCYNDNGITYCSDINNRVNQSNLPKTEFCIANSERIYNNIRDNTSKEDNSRELSHSLTSNSVKECTNILRNNCLIDCSNLSPKRRSRGICCKEGTPSSAYEINITEDDLLNNEKAKNLVVKTMDKSVDSIGSCSLDVDAENTDFSDTTSGSLNILTPSSTASHFKDFASKFQERAGIAASVTAHQDLRGYPLEEETSHLPAYQDIAAQLKQSNQFLFNNPQPKKPSYLHLACSVNGYSNLTTYDSTLRQKLSKSREQSPARIGNISSFMLRNCQPNNANMANNTTKSIHNNTYFKTSLSETSISSQNVITYLKSNGQTISSETHASKSYHAISNGSVPDSPSKSFIQQRVERLYGPGALAQGFFNQKKQLTKESDRKSFNGENGSHVIRTEHITKTQNGVTNNETYINYENDQDESVLPVFRHLRAEFRAQLPLLSPKRSPLSKFADNSSRLSNTQQPSESCNRLKGDDVVDRVELFCSNGKLAEENNSVVTIIPIQKSESSLNNNKSSNGDLLPKTGVSSDIDSKFVIDDVNNATDESNRPELNAKAVNEKFESYENIPVIEQIIFDNNATKSAKDSDKAMYEDGHYFLALCRAEMLRLEQLADLAELELKQLQNVSDISEEVRGFLRVAAGKARLLASEKMKQFEGLCFKNLNAQPDNKFPTTIEDLRGFWDMVYLQVDDIRILFEQIDAMKKSDWKMIPTTKRSFDTQAKPTSSRPQTSNNKKSTKTKIEAAPASKSALSKKRDEERKALIEAKRRAAKLQSNASVEIFANSPPALDQQSKSEES